MSGDENTEQNQPQAGPPPRQPVFLLPVPVTALCGLMLALEVYRVFILNDAGDLELLTWLAFFPYRLVDPASVDGGWLPLLWTPFTHAFLHAGWEHLLLNVAWLAIFGSPVTSRYGGTRMFVLFLVGAAVGAIAFAATTLPQPQVLIGASGGIAALTGAAVRFIFQPPVIIADPESGEPVSIARRLATIPEVLLSPRARFFSLVWVVINGIVPLLPVLTGMDVQIAWQAHLGGFFAGFFLVPLFERRG